ncbi:hypothetical protein EBR78_02065 [bacterium]|nr:hypothetical protein [bacterium]NBX83221.1 hypothetical protein [bacterium]
MKLKPNIKQIDSLWVFMVATAFLGPFALPLLWANRRWSVKIKVVGTVVIIGLTGLLIYLLKYALVDWLQEMESLSQ